MILGPWDPSPTYSVELAQLIRACIRQEKRLMEIDRWLPFPQTSCSFAFGFDAKPIPVGALFLLWRECPDFTTRCAFCGGTVRGYSCCALNAVGNISGCCDACGKPHTRFVAGLSAARDLFRPHLDRTEYQISRANADGCFPGPREPLFRALYDLGEWNL